MSDFRGTLRAFILERFLPGEPAANLSDDMSLREGGVVDSMGTMDIVRFVEETYGLSVEPHETDEGNFGSVDAIVGFVERKRAGGR